MTDSCFKVFRAKCLRKSSLKSLRDSRESFYGNEKSALDETASLDKKINFDTNATSIDNNKRVKPDNITNDPEQGMEIEPDVILRRPNRVYHRSVSSYDAFSSEEEEENMDVLAPLPHDYSPSEEDGRKIFTDNGTKVN